MQRYDEFPISRAFSVYGEAAFVPDLSNAVHVVFEYKGFLDLNLLERVAGEIVRRHTVLRSKVCRHGGGLIYIPTEDVTGYNLIFEDLSVKPAEANRDAAYAHVSNIILLPFNIEIDPAIRMAIVKYSVDEYMVGIVINHIFSDGSSINTFCNEFAILYDAYCNHRSPTLPDLPLQYNDYLKYLEKMLAEESGRVAWDYYQSRLATVKAPQFPQNADRTGAMSFLVLPAELAAELRLYCRRQKVTLFEFMLAVNCQILSEVSQLDNVCMLVVHSGRTIPQLQNMIAPLFDMTPCCVRADVPFTTLLQSVQREWHTAYRHGFIPFNRLLPLLQEGSEQRCFPTFNFLPAPLTAAKIEMGSMATALQSATTIRATVPRWPEWSYEPPFNLRVQDGPQISILMRSPHGKCSDGAIQNYLDQLRVISETAIGGAMV